MRTAVLSDRLDDVPLGLMSPTLHHDHPPRCSPPLLSRATAAPLACGTCLVAAAAYIAVDDPGTDGPGLLACPFRAATGLWCPGCGLTRATHHLARGNILDALSLNLLAPFLLGALLLAWWTWLHVARGSGTPRSMRRVPTHAYIAAGGVVAVFTVLRNLPGVEVLRGG